MSGGGNSGGVFNPTNLYLFTYTANNPVNLIDPDGLETTGEFLNRWAKDTVYRDVSNNRSGVQGATATFVATTWDFLGFESLSKVADNSMNGRDDMSTSDYVWAGIEVGTLGIGKFAKFGKSVWNLNKFERGREIHKMLGENLGTGNFPVVDKLANGVLSSIKTIDLNAQTYQSASKLKSTLKGYINKLDNFTEMRWGGSEVTQGMYNQKALDLAMPHRGNKAQQNAINEAINYAKGKGIDVNIHIIK